jgi:hypothetical protein
MIIRDLKQEPEWGTIWSWRTQDDRPAAYRHNNKGPEVVVGIKGGKTDGLWNHTGPEFGADARLIVCRNGLGGRMVNGRWTAYSDKDESHLRAYIEAIDLPTEGLP